MNYTEPLLQEKEKTTALGKDAQSVLQNTKRVETFYIGHSEYNYSRHRQALKTKFEYLKNTWKQETRFNSDIKSIINHPAYQEIIQLGPAIIPFILEELQNKPDHWFYALTALTGAHPIKAENRGKIGAMAQDWLDWAENKGLL